MGADNSEALTEAEFASVMQLKKDGNGSFGTSNWDKAEESYQAAIDIYEDSGKAGSDGPQREALIALLSNLSLVYLKKGLAADAEMTASKCLALDQGHKKAAYRRATARLQISYASRNGDPRRIQGAFEDVQICDPSDATRKLMHQIHNEIRKVQAAMSAGQDDCCEEIDGAVS